MKLKHFHTGDPFLCVKATMLGWAVCGQCDPELVELCSEMPVGDVKFLPDLDAMFEQLERRGVSDEEAHSIRERMSQPA